MPPELLCDDRGWIERLLDRVESDYLGSHDLLATIVSAEGVVQDDEPLIADFGDVLPFMEHFGRQKFVRKQIDLARSYLKSSLYSQNGRVRLFSNHDWLLGLLELHRITGESSFLRTARDGATELIQNFVIKGLLVDEAPSWRHPRTLLCAASPFNGGYIELLIELHRETGAPIFKNAAEQLAAAWVDTADFKRRGLFSRQLCAYSRTIGTLLRPATQMRARLFKDNTNLVWGLLDLFLATRGKIWETAINSWILQFEKNWLNDGLPYLWLDNHFSGKQVLLRAAFSTIDLFCDLAMNSFSADHALNLARRIADRWLESQWENGLFPEYPGCNFDHLDSNVDMSVALMKLAALTSDSSYSTAAAKTANATVTIHQANRGLVLSVSREGAVADSRIFVKYQALALKLAILPKSPAALIDDPHLLYLLRDR